MSGHDSTADRPNGAGRKGRSTVFILCLLLWFFVAYQIIYWWIYRPWGHIGSDFNKHWYASRALLDGLSIYHGNHLEMEFNHPHAMAYLFCWLGCFEFPLAGKLWECLQMVFISSCWVLAWKGLRPVYACSEGGRIVQENWALFCAVSVFGFSPLVTNVLVGNIDALNCFLILGMVASMVRNRHYLAGILWAATILSKVVPILLVVPFLVGRQWKLLLAGLASIVLYLIALLTNGKLGGEWHFFTEVLPEIGWYWRGVSTSSGRFILDMMGRTISTEEQAVYNGVNMTCSFAIGIFYVAMAWIFWLRRANLLRLLELSLLFLPLFSPLLHWHHFVWVLPAWFLQVNRCLVDEMSRRFQVLNLVGWLFLAFSFQINDLFSPNISIDRYSHLVAGVFLVFLNTIEFISHDVR